jgi:hypothetical protein
MAQTSYPFENADTTEGQFSQLFRRLQSTGVSGSPGTTDLKAFGDSSGMNVKVPAGYAIVRGHAYNNDAQVTMTISAASSLPRIDVLVLKLDPTANSIVLNVVAGTANASPTVPSLTQTDEGVYMLPLAQILVGANVTTISAGSVTDVRTFNGTQFGRWTTATRPGSPTVGHAGFNTTTSLPELWNGSAWVTFNNGIVAADVSAAEQANLVAGKIRAGGTSSGTATTIFVQSGTPTANATGDLWFW